MMGMTNPETVHYGMWDGSSIVICAYALTLILITVKRKEYPHVFMLFVPASVMFLFIMYIPGIYSHLPLTYNNDRRQVFRRFRWLFMMLPVLSFGMSFIFMKMKNKQRILTGIVCGLLLMSSVFYTSDGQEEYGFWDRSNAQNHLYKISHVAKAMGDTISDREGEYLDEDSNHTVTLLVSDDGKGEWERSIVHNAQQLRMYLSPVHYTTVQLTESDCNKKGFDLGTLVDRKYDYILCPDTERVISLYQNAGYEVLWRENGNCFMADNKSSNRRSEK